MKTFEQQRISRAFVQQYIDRIYRLESLLDLPHKKVDIRGNLGEVLSRLRSYMYTLEDRIRAEAAQTC